MKHITFLVLLCLPIFSSASAMDDIFDPENQGNALPALDDTPELLANTQISEDPSTDFSLFRFELTSNPTIAKQFGEQAALANIKFDQLIKADTNPNKELTTLLHNMTKDLHGHFNKYSAKGLKKAMTARKKLRYWLREISLLDLDEGLEIALDKFRQYLETAMLPAMKASGIWEQFRALPLATIATGTATAAVLYWAIKSKLINNLINALGSFTDAVNHLKESEREANRARAAFYKEVEVDDAATELNQQSDDPKVQGLVEYIRIADFETKKTWYLRKYPEPPPASEAELPLWNARRHEWIRKRITDFRERLPTWKDNWSTARLGVFERMIEALMAYVPTVKELGKQLVRNAHIQQEWFKAHRIGKNRHMAPVLIAKVSESDTPIPSDFSLRYISDQTLTPEQLSAHIAEHGSTTYLGREIIPFLWRNPKNKAPDASRGWHYTFMPDRNTVEQLIITLKEANDPHTPIGRLVDGISLQLQINNRNYDLWLEAIQPPSSQDLRTEREKQIWEEIKDGDNEAKKLAYRPRYRAHFEGADLRTEAERQAGVPPRYSDKKRMYFVGLVPGIPHTNEAGEHLMEEGQPLFRHYPDINILEKLTRAIDSLNDVENPGARFVEILGSVLQQSYGGYADWLHKNGLATHDEHYRVRMNPDVRRLIDDQNHAYFIHVDADGNQVGERIPDQGGGINGLWDALGALVHNPEAGISSLVRTLADVTTDVTQDDSKLVGTIDKLVANALQRARQTEVAFKIPFLGRGNVRIQTPLDLNMDDAETTAPDKQSEEEAAEVTILKADKAIEATGRAINRLQEQLSKVSPERSRWYKPSNKVRRGAAVEYHRLKGEIAGLQRKRDDAAFKRRQAEQQVVMLKKKGMLYDDAYSMIDTESVML